MKKSVDKLPNLLNKYLKKETILIKKVQFVLLSNDVKNIKNIKINLTDYLMFKFCNDKLQAVKTETNKN